MSDNQQPTPLAETTEAERGTPKTNTSKQPKEIKSAVFWIGFFFAFCGAVFGVGMFLKRAQAQNQESNAKKLEQVNHTTENATPKDFDKDQKDIKAAEKAAGANTPKPDTAKADAAKGNASNGEMVPPISAKESQGTPASTPVSTTPANTNPENSPLHRKMSGNVMIETESSHPSESTAGGQSVSLLGRSDAQFAQPRGAKDSLDERFTPSELVGTRAKLRNDLNFLLRRGTVVPCVLKTKIVSTYPGMTSCQVSKDVYGANGKVLLIERGSEVIGEQRAALNQGQARIFVLWSRIETPKGVSVDVNSPGTDALGATGHEAQVDTHFWERFGGAILLSLIDDFAAAATSTNGGSGNAVYLSNTSNASQAMAAKALESTINIPPTGYTNQGALLNVFVARDVDFRSVYELIHVDEK
ncbi:MAG: type IV secretion system protein VirB10 [Pseudomonadota bacterium]